MELKTVKRSDHQFLYDMLKERTEKTNISHQHMPEWEDHLKFCNSKPYKIWLIGWERHFKVGMCYLTDRNEIGVFIKDGFRRRGYAKEMIEHLIKQAEGSVLANINPTNRVSRRMFSNLDFWPVQVTYKKKRDLDSGQKV